MVLADGTLEYLYTAGLLVSFAGLIIGTALNRKQIAGALHHSGFTKRDLALGIIAVLVFLGIVD